MTVRHAGPTVPWAVVLIAATLGCAGLFALCVWAAKQVGPWGAPTFGAVATFGVVGLAIAYGLFAARNIR
jgi:hypothetical protein